MDKKIGLVLGSFCPLHNGHLSLIDFGLSNCDFLYVLLCSHDKEDFPGDIRYEWLREEYEYTSNIKIIHKDTSHLENTSVSNVDISRTWSVYLKELFPDVNIIFTSEKYGDYVSDFMNIEHKQFDQKRISFPISSTLIRENPIKYWEYLPMSVKPHYVKKVVIMGPESVGKSTMTKNLAKHFNSTFVEEYGRTYCEEVKSSSDFVYEDFLNIARIHYDLVENEVQYSNGVMFVDTEAITTKIFVEKYINKFDNNELDEFIEKQKYDLFVLLNCDVPWVDDGTRDFPTGSEEHFIRIKEELDNRNLPYIIIGGDSHEERTKKTILEIEKFIYN